MDKNTIWAIVLTTLVIIVFSTLQMTLFAPQTTEQVVSEQVAEAIDEEPVIETETAAAAVEENTVIVTEEQIPEQSVELDTDLFHVVFTNKGGDITSLELKGHKDGEKLVNMVDNATETNRAFAIAFGSDATAAIINDTFNVKKIDDTTISFYRSFAVKNSDGSVSRFKLTKKYTFLPDEYTFKLDVFIDGDSSMNGLSINDNAYILCSTPQIGPYYDPKRDRYENRTFFYLQNGKSKNMTVNEDAVKIVDKDYSWAAITGKYFSVITAPSDASTIGKAFFSRAVNVDSYADAQVKLSRKAIEGSSAHDTYYIYAGPKVETYLSLYNNSAKNGWSISNMKFDECLSTWGILRPLEIALKWIMEMFNLVVHNWGVSIIIMTILLRLVLYPLTKKSSVANVKMQAYQPRIKEIQDKYKDTPDKMNLEMSKFYKEIGYNPMSGCLPILIQFPLIIAMYNLFNNYFDFRGAMFIPGWIPDLSVGDSVYEFSFTIPLLNTTHLRLLPIIYVVSQLFYGKFTQATTPQAGGATGSTMKIMMYGMPLFFFFIFYSAPAGLLLYWTVSNFLTLVQQIFINKSVAKEREKLEAETPKKEVFTKKTKK